MGAADTSSNWRFVSIVVGVTDDINRICKNLGFSGIHMRQLNKDHRHSIIKRLEINGEVQIMCLNVGRFQITNQLHDRMDKNSRTGKRKYIEDQFDYVFVSKIKRILCPFLTSHSITMDNMVFEIDTDLRKCFSLLGLRYKDPDFTHQIADIIAHCNTKGKRIPNVPEIDLSGELMNSLSKRLGI